MKVLFSNKVLMITLKHIATKYQNLWHAYTNATPLNYVNIHPNYECEILFFLQKFQLIYTDANNLCLSCVAMVCY